MKTRSWLRVLAMILAVSAVASPALYALTGQLTVIRSWRTEGNANPALTYVFQSNHQVFFSSFTGSEALWDVKLDGELDKDGWKSASCVQRGFVVDINLRCSVPQPVGEARRKCPAAQGIWDSISRTQIEAPNQTFFESTSAGPLYANCPPPGVCALGIPSDVDRVISLDTGLPVDAGHLVGIPSVRLNRKAEDSHGEFMLDEWAIVEPAGGGLMRVESASSDRYSKHLSQEPVPLLESIRKSHGLDPGTVLKADRGRYLVVQGSGHRYRLPLPIVKMGQLPLLDNARQGVERVALRVMFDHHGGVQSIETLDGRASLAQPLAESLGLEFVSGAEHRVALFAVFEIVAGQAELLSAVPVLPRCCCGVSFCV